jgi:hypothetical protein
VTMPLARRRTPASFDPLEESARITAIGLSPSHDEVIPSDYYFSCGPRRNVGTASNVIVVVVQMNTTEMASANMPWSGGLLGTTIHLTARADRVGGTAPQTGDSALACNASDGGIPTGVTLSSTLFPDGQIGLRTFGATAWFDYLFAVEPRPAP